jgi:SAM-dependent MidA family methyltransferase
MSLLDFIRNELRLKDSVPFVEFMHQALYAPNLGYYSSGSQKFGRRGDFVTAPELTPLFGQALAHQCQQVLSTLVDPILLEFGAGSGQLCVDILTHLEQLNSLPREYHILEVSGHLQDRQRELIAATCPHLADRVTWLSQWPKESFNGVVIANEVFDAMPVHRFLQTEQGLLESYISLNSNEDLHEVFKPCSNPRLTAHVKNVLAQNLYPYLSEANLFIDDWFRQCYSSLNCGMILILDYGFPRHEYYHRDRHNGTLMCHYRHLAHTNPLIHIGEQDITAHVDFTHLADAAHAAGFHVAGYTNQACEHAKMTGKQAAKQLLHPSEMGELFKVIALTKNSELALNGFQLQDKRASL